MVILKVTFRKQLLLFLATALLAVPAPAQDSSPVAADRANAPANLSARLQSVIHAHRGRVAVAIKNMKTGEAFEYHADEVMPTASLIKFPVMIEAYRQAAAGKVNLDSRLVLKAEDKVPGSGILTSHFSAGASFTLRDAVRLMIAFSDNTATNLVLDSIGLGATAATMESMGCPNTKIHSKVFHRETSVFPDRSKQFGLGSTTASEMVRLCEDLHHRRLVNPAASQSMYEHMLACDDHEKYPRFLPPGTRVAFKTGSLADTRTAAGVIECPAGPVAVCVLTCDNQDRRWVPENEGNVLCAKVAGEVYAHFDRRP